MAKKRVYSTWVLMHYIPSTKDCGRSNKKTRGAKLHFVTKSLNKWTRSKFCLKIISIF